jgi:polyhydroxybutyrate depolymerase
MRRKLIFWFAIACTVAVAVAVAIVAGANIFNAVERQSVTSTHSIEVGGLTRSWEQITPTAPLPKSAPVIVVLSGISASVSSEIQRDHLIPYVTAGKAELVYPAGYQKSWNAGGCCGAAAAANVDDTGFLKALVARVDPGHAHPIYLVGYSNGGRLAYRMACGDPGVFDEIAVVKADPQPGCAVTRPQTILQVAAKNDTAVPYQPGDSGRETPAATVQIARLRDADECPGNGATTAHGAMTIASWAGCADGTRLGFALWDSGGHSFPQPKGNTPAAAQVIWSFFTRTPLSPLPS